MTNRAISTRDAGLALIRRINRWMIAGAVVASGAISLVAARSFSGHTSSASAATSQSSQSASGANGSSSSGSGLSQPSQSPSSSSGSSGSAPVVSGGS